MFIHLRKVLTLLKPRVSKTSSGREQSTILCVILSKRKKSRASLLPSSL